MKMRCVASIFLVVLLASCGVDGAPTPPAEPGLTVTGTARIGVSGSL